MTKDGRLPGGARDRAEQARLAASGLRPLGWQKFCDGMHSSVYVAGIDFYCDGEASRLGRTHDRQVIGRFRHATCEKSEIYAAQSTETHSWWMKPTADGHIPEEISSAGIERYRLECPTCPFDHQLNGASIDRLMADVWRRHALKVERRNVATLLNS